MPAAEPTLNSKVYTMLTREQMARRAALEIAEGQRAFYGPGLPQAVQAVASASAQPASGSPSTASDSAYDIAFVEALEVDARGALTLAPETSLPEAKRVIAIMLHTLADGAARIRAQVSAGGAQAQRLITDRAVIDVTPAGLVLREVERSHSAADVQLHTAAPLLADATLALIAV